MSGGKGVERVRPLVDRLERYLDVLDRLITTLEKSYFLRIQGDAAEDVAGVRSHLRSLLACAQHRYEIAHNVFHAMLQMADPIYVAPREAFQHGRDVRDALKDLAIKDQAFGRAVSRAEREVSLRLSRPRAWGELDHVEQAIIRHLHSRPRATRKQIEAAMRRHSPATVWRRLQRLIDEGHVEKRRDSRGGGEAGTLVMSRETIVSKRAGEKPGGSRPYVFWLSERGEGLNPDVSDA